MSNETTTNKGETKTIDPDRLTFEELFLTLESGVVEQGSVDADESFLQLNKVLQHIFPRLEKHHENADNLSSIDLELTKQKVLILLTQLFDSLKPILNHYFDGDRNLMGLPINLSSVLLYRLYRLYEVDEDGYAHVEQVSTMKKVYSLYPVFKYMETSYYNDSGEVVDDYSFDNHLIEMADDYGFGNLPWSWLEEGFSVKFRPRTISLEDQVAYNFVKDAVFTGEFEPFLSRTKFCKR